MVGMAFDDDLPLVVCRQEVGVLVERACVAGVDFRLVELEVHHQRYGLAVVVQPGALLRFRRRRRGFGRRCDRRRGRLGRWRWRRDAETVLYATECQAAVVAGRGIAGIEAARTRRAPRHAGIFVQDVVGAENDAQLIAEAVAHRQVEQTIAVVDVVVVGIEPAAVVVVAAGQVPRADGVVHRRAEPRPRGAALDGDPAALGGGLIEPRHLGAGAVVAHQHIRVAAAPCEPLGEHGVQPRGLRVVVVGEIADAVEVRGRGDAGRGQGLPQGIVHVQVV